MNWKTSGEFSVPAGPASSINVTARVNTPPPLPAVVYVMASVSGVDKVDSSAIQIVGPPEAASNDWIFSDQTANDPPSYVFLTGTGNSAEGPPVNNSLLAFVREGALPSFTCPTAMANCGVATVFAPGLGVKRAAVNWKNGCDVVVFGSPSTVTGCAAAGTAVSQPARIKVPVTIWTLAKGDRIDDQVSADKAYAEWVFSQPLVGIDLVFTVHSFDVKHGSLTHGIGCKTSTGDDIANDIRNRFANVTFDKQTISVLYVDGINPGTGDDIGFTCQHDPTVGTISIISANAINNSTLAHELGHALGQWHSSERDHPDVPPPRLEGFDPSNLMWSSETDWGVSLRRNLTLGQLFQMNFADFSFVQRTGAGHDPALACSTDAGSSYPCAVLARDER